METRTKKYTHFLVASIALCFLSACAIGPGYQSNLYSDADLNPKKQCFAQLRAIQDHSIILNVDKHGRNINVNSFQHVHNFHESSHCEMMPTVRDVAVQTSTNSQ